MERAAANPRVWSPRPIAAAGGTYALIVGALTLLGYALDVRRLTDWYDNNISMFPNAAACAALSGVALLLLTTAGDRKAGRIVVRATAGVVGLVGGLTLLEHLAGVNLGIDTLLFERSWGQEAATAPMRIGPPASTSYLLIGAGLLLSTFGPRAKRFASALGIVVVVIASLSLIGYWFGSKQFFAAHLTGIAFQTSTALASIGVGLIASLPEHGLAAMLRRDDPGGVIVRRLLLPIIVIPLALGWLRIIGQEAGYFDARFGIAALALMMILMLFALLWWTADGVSRQARLTRAAEQGVRDSEARHRALFEVSVYGVLTIDDRGIIESANPAAERLFGYSSSEMIGRNISMLMPEPYHAEHDSYLQNYLRTGERQVIGIGREVAGRRKDGSTFPMELAVAEFQLGDKRYFKGIVHDVSERKRAERSLRESEARLRSIIEQLPAGVGVMDAKGQWLLTNSTMEQYVPTAIPSTQSGRVERWRFWDDGGRPIPPENWPGQRALGGETVMPGMEALYTQDDGREIWMRVSAAPLRNEAGEVIGATAVVQDIDLPRRFNTRLHEELDKRVAELAGLHEQIHRTEAMAILGSLSSGIAHDLGNLLLPLRTRVEILELTELTPEVAEHVRAIATGVGYIGDLARRLRQAMSDVAREHQLAASSSEAVNLARWCRDAEPFLRTIVPPPMALVFDVPRDLPLVRINKVGLTQATYNLVQNSMKAMRRSGVGRTITLRAAASTSPGHLEILVEDDGPGMPPDVQARCLEARFTTDADTGGMGLGLSLVRTFVQAAGGEVAVFSPALGNGTPHGTAVVLRFPAHAPEIVISEPKPPSRVGETAAGPA